MRRAAALLGVLGTVAGTAGCGTPSPDLFVVTRTGSVPGAKLKLLVSDTSVRCNRGPRHELSSKQILTARELSEDLNDLAEKPRPPRSGRRASIFAYSVRTEHGTLRFTDTDLRPNEFARTALFTRRTAIDVCHLKR